MSRLDHQIEPTTFCVRHGNTKCAIGPVKYLALPLPLGPGRRGRPKKVRLDVVKDDMHANNLSRYNGCESPSEKKVTFLTLFLRKILLITKICHKKKHTQGHLPGLDFIQSVLRCRRIAVYLEYKIKFGIGTWNVHCTVQLL